MKKKLMTLLVAASMLVMSIGGSVLAAPEDSSISAKASYAESDKIPAIDGSIEAVWQTTEAVYSDYCYVEGMGQAYGYSKILWTEDALYFLTVVEDATMEGIGEDSTTNCINLWVSETASAEEAFGNVAGDWHYASNAAGNTYYYCGNDMNGIAECAAVVTETGYIVEVKVDAQTADLVYEEGHVIGFNLSVDDDLDGDNERDAFCTWQNHDETGAYWAVPASLNKVELVKYDLPQAQAAYASTVPTIDGEWEEIWDKTEGFWTDLWYIPDAGLGYGYAKVLWSEDTLYLLAVVEDATLEGIPEDSTTNGVSFWLSEEATAEEAFGNVPGDIWYGVNQASYLISGNELSKAAEHAVKVYDGMYIVEVAIPVQTDGLTYEEGHVIGFNISIDDDWDGDDQRDSCCSWQLVDFNRPYWAGPEWVNKLELVSAAKEPLVTGNPIADVEQTTDTEEPTTDTEEPTTDTEEPASNNTPLYIGAAVVVVLVAGVLVVRKKK